MKKQTKEFLEILMLTQEELYNYIIDFLTIRDIKYKAKDEAYIYINDHAWNVTRPLLTSHLDTINDSYNELPRLSIKDNIITTTNKAVLGGDDRAGVWVMLQLLDKGIKDYDYVFFCDEEVGGLGSKLFAKEHLIDIIEYSCYISLDRRGSKEVASYGYDNDDLVKVFTDIGYTSVRGSFTDCVNLSNVTEVACINLSVGYNNEHTNSEVQDITVMYNLVNRLSNDSLIDKLSTREYRYEDIQVYNNQWSSYKEVLNDPMLCDCCGEHLPLYDCDVSGNSYYLCSDCLKYY